jgi:hypothetical protein
MVTRGLLLILSYSDVSSLSWYTVTIQCLKLFEQVTNKSPSAAHVVAHQPKLVLFDLITQLQDLLTNMVLFSRGLELYAELFELAVRALGFLHRVNLKYKSPQN